MPYDSQAKSDADSSLIASADGNNETDLSRPFAVVWKGSPHCRILWAKLLKPHSLALVEFIFDSRTSHHLPTANN
jgi:hypothetical protein